MSELISFEARPYRLVVSHADPLEPLVAAALIQLVAERVDDIPGPSYPPEVISHEIIQATLRHSFSRKGKEADALVTATDLSVCLSFAKVERRGTPAAAAERTLSCDKLVDRDPRRSVEPELDEANCGLAAMAGSLK